MSELEDKLNEKFEELNTSDRNRVIILSYLDVLKEKHLPTYNHSIRVGLLSIEVSKYLGRNPKSLFYAGLLHDLGKAGIEQELLEKTEGFNDEDLEKMSNHTLYAYEILSGIHQYSAEVALRHHRDQENGYPHILPISKVNFSKKTYELIECDSRILGMIDFYDSAKYRTNDKHGKKRQLSSKEVKEKLLEKKPFLKEIALDLYSCGVLN